MAWFKDWFNTKYYHILYKDRNKEEAENFISKMIEFLALEKGSSVIDLCCGKGRHSQFLNQLGFQVLGLDLSEESIKHNLTFENENLKFAVHDMRDALYPMVTDKVKAVFSLFTSFGYFDAIEEDEKVFRSIENVLEDSGFFVLDFLNEKWVKNTLKPEEVIRKNHIDFHIKKYIENQHITKEIRFEDEGELYEYREKVKLHTLQEIENLGIKLGFKKIAVFGDYLLNDFNRETSPRCIFVFRKEL